MFVAIEEVEACAARGEEHGVAGSCDFGAGGNGVGDRMSVADYGHFIAEEIEEFSIVDAHADDSFHLIFDEIFYFGIIVAFIFSAEYKDSGASHAFEGIPSRIDVGSLRIVDIDDAIFFGYEFEAMLYGFEIGEGFASDIIADIEHGSG